MLVKSRMDNMEKIQDHFKQAFARHPAGVSVITANTPSGPVGLTATSVCSVSLDPPALMFSLSANSSTAPAILGADSLVIHLLDAGGQALAKRFATSGIDRFAGTDWKLLPSGEPLLTEAASWFRGSVIHIVDIGGSTVVMVGIEEAGHNKKRDSSILDVSEQSRDSPLVYCNRTWHALHRGSSIKNAN